MPATPITPSQYYDIAVANGVSPSSTAPGPTSSAAWQTAIAAAKGTPVNGLSSGYQVVKSRTVNGAVVETDIVGNEVGPQAEITVDRSSRTVIITQLDPTSGKPLIDPLTHKPYHETVSEDAQGQYHTSGDLTTSNYGNYAGVDVNLIQSETNLSSEVGINVSDSNYLVGNGQTPLGPGALVITPLAPGEHPNAFGNFDGVWLNTFNSSTDPNGTAAANTSTMTSVSAAGTYVTTNASKPAPGFDWTHIFQPWT